MHRGSVEGIVCHDFVCCWRSEVDVGTRSSQAARPSFGKSKSRDQVLVLGTRRQHVNFRHRQETFQEKRRSISHTQFPPDVTDPTVMTKYLYNRFETLIKPFSSNFMYDVFMK